MVQPDFDTLNGIYEVYVYLCLEKHETNEKNDVTLIIVALDDPRAGERQRNKYPAISKKYADQRGTPFGREDHAYQIKSKKGKSHELKARVIMFPFTLAWAATGHCMQVKIALIT